MADYWGARAYRASGGPNGEGTSYVRPDYADIQFTGRAGDGNDTSIEEIYQQIMNQHPEDISVLADQWVNAYNLLDSVKQQLLEQSTTLYNEYWRSAQARDAFMLMGPGQALAYLDEWMDSVSNNVQALRALVTIAENSREEMRRLWGRYEDAVAAAEDISVGDWFRSARHASWWFGAPDGSDGTREEAMQQVNEARERYNREAQELAERIAEEYMTYFGTINSGHGPPFYEMDAVLNVPGHQPLPSLGGMPGAPPPAAPPAAAPVSALAPVPVGLPGAAPPAPPVNEWVPVAPTAREVVVPAVGTVPEAPAMTGDAPGLPAVAAVPGVPAPTGAPVAARRPPAAPGAGPARGPAGPAGAGLRDGVLQGRGAGSLPAAPAKPATRAGTPPPGARSTGTEPPPGRTIGRTPGGPPAARGQGRSPGGTPSAAQPGPNGASPAGVDEAFTRPPVSTAPPVLRGRQPGTRRPDVASPPSPGGAGRDVPVPPSRPGRARTDRVAGAEPDAAAEWLGAGAVRADATPPVLDAPQPPPPGSPVSKLEEVPKHLRGERARAGAPARSGTPRGVVPAELAPRRAVVDGDEGARRGPREDEAARIVTDEDAFGVASPGGGVLGKQPEDRAYRQEPPPAIAAG
jgi:hypothetical protein